MPEVVIRNNNVTVYVTQPSTLETVKVIQGPAGPQGPSGLVQSVVAGANVTVNNTDPANPVVSAATPVVDHGALTGLADDDHTQYALADGSRGTFEAAGAVTTHTAASDPHGDRAYAAALFAAAKSQNVDTDEATTSTSFVDLATVGPSVTVTVPASGRVLILITAQMYNSSGGSLNRVSFAASGANTVAASSNFALASQMDTGGRRLAATYAGMLTGLAAGSTTFTLKYYTNAGTANFAFRRITVIPF